MVTKENFDALRMDLSVKSKNGLDFIMAATIVWLIIAYVWTLNFSAYNKSVFTFLSRRLPSLSGRKTKK